MLRDLCMALFDVQGSRAERFKAGVLMLVFAGLLGAIAYALVTNGLEVFVGVEEALDDRPYRRRRSAVGTLPVLMLAGGGLSGAVALVLTLSGAATLLQLWRPAKE